LFYGGDLDPGDINSVGFSDENTLLIVGGSSTYAAVNIPTVLQLRSTASCSTSRPMPHSIPSRPAMTSAPAFLMATAAPASLPATALL